MRFLKNLNLSTSLTDYPYQCFAFYAILAYPCYYIIWDLMNVGSYNCLLLRLVSVVLCIPLIIYGHWPDKIKPYLVSYWHLVICYSFPYIFTLEAIINGFSDFSVLNSMIMLALMIFLLDFMSLTVVLIVGAVAAYVTALMCSIPIHRTGTLDMANILIAYCSILLFAALFAHDRKKAQQIKKEELMRRKRAEKASNAKSIFISHLSHDLRTPFAGMMGLVDGLLRLGEKAQDFNQGDKHRNNGVLTEMTEQLTQDGRLLKSSMEHLLNFFDEVLDVVRLEAKQQKPQSTYFKPRDLLQAKLNLFRPAAQEKGLDLSFAFDESCPEVLHGSRNLLSRILVNLISNAIKYTEKGAVKIDLSVAQATQSSCVLRLTVSDTGCGITKAQQDRMFDRFSRLTPAFSRDLAGVGLGLYAVKRYVEVMGGEIEVISEVDKGTDLIVRLPFQPADFSEAITHDAKNSSLSSTVSRHVLLVEDDILAARAASYLLRELGCEVTHVKTGLEGLALAQQQVFSIIFMDIGLPDIDGIECSKRIQSGNLNKTTPIVALSGHASESSVYEDSCSNGLVSMIQKPAKQDDFNLVLSMYATETC